MLPLFQIGTGDNIFGGSATDAAVSLLRAISPAMEYKVPWAAILGNHDQESTMTREELMTFMSLMDYSVSQVNPPGFLVHGFGNYHIGIHGPFGSELVNTSLLNLYFLDSGDREVVNGVKTYGWIKESQLAWLRTTSLELQVLLIMIDNQITTLKLHCSLCTLVYLIDSSPIRKTHRWPLVFRDQIIDFFVCWHYLAVTNTAFQILCF